MAVKIPVVNPAVVILALTVALATLTRAWVICVLPKELAKLAVPIPNAVFTVELAITDVVCVTTVFTDALPTYSDVEFAITLAPTAITVVLPVKIPVVNAVGVMFAVAVLFAI